MITLTALLLHSLATPTYAVLKEFPIPGDTGWDLLTVDSDSQRLYISRGTHVQVLATDSGKIVGDITDLQGAHGIAVAPKLGKGFITSGRDNAVIVFDLKTNKETSRINVGKNPDAILFDATSGHVFSFNAQSNDVSVIDGKSGKVVTSISFDGNPELPVADGHGHVFVNLESTSKVVEIDTKANKVTRTWAIAPGEEPTGIGLDAKHGYIFSVCANSLMAVSDVKSGKLLYTLPIGAGPDSAGFDSGFGIAFSSNGDGTLTLAAMTGGKFAPIQTVATKQSARTMALDAKRHLVYLIAADFDAPKAGERRGKMKPGTASILVVGPAKN